MAISFFGYYRMYIVFLFNPLTDIDAIWRRISEVQKGKGHKGKYNNKLVVQK